MLKVYIRSIPSLCLIVSEGRKHTELCEAVTLAHTRMHSHRQPPPPSRLFPSRNKSPREWNTATWFEFVKTLAGRHGASGLYVRAQRVTMSFDPIRTPPVRPGLAASCSQSVRIKNGCVLGWALPSTPDLMNQYDYRLTQHTRQRQGYDTERKQSKGTRPNELTHPLVARESLGSHVLNIMFVPNWTSLQ